MILTSFPANPFCNILEEIINEEVTGPDRCLPAYWRNKTNSVDVGHVISQVNDEKKFSVTVDVSHFHPRELNVRLDDQTLIVEGKTHRNGEFSEFDRQFRRSWTLPEDIKAANLKSSLSEHGHLTIEAMKTLPPREIPITFVQKKENKPELQQETMQE